MAIKSKKSTQSLGNGSCSWQISSWLWAEPLSKLQANIWHQLRTAKTSDKASTLALRTFPLITTICSSFLPVPKAVRSYQGFSAALTRSSAHHKISMTDGSSVLSKKTSLKTDLSKEATFELLERKTSKQRWVTEKCFHAQITEKLFRILPFPISTRF